MSFGRSPGEGSVCSKMIDLVELVSMSISFRGMQRERESLTVSEEAGAAVVAAAQAKE